MNEIQAPNKLSEAKNTLIFLAGSIEMGTAEKWQEKVINDCIDAPVTFLNPRRDDWDSTWNQSFNDSNFNQQVNWELNAMEKSDLIVMYFDPNSKSPITLLELGLHARSGKLIVCCPDGFWRKGNVDIVCEKYGVKMVPSLDELIFYINSNYIGYDF